MATASERSEPPGGRRPASRLARLDFADPERAGRLLAAEPLGWWDPAGSRPVDAAAEAAITVLGHTADPDGALTVLAALASRACGAGEAGDRPLPAAITGDVEVRDRLLMLLGTSPALADHLLAYPAHWRALTGPRAGDPGGAARRLAEAVGADPDRPATGTGGDRARLTGPVAVDALRAAYRRELVAVAGRDLAGHLTQRETTVQLADLAGHTLQAALAVAAAELPPAAAPCRLAIVAMGKTGGRELNYVSDVDVIFAAEPGAVDGDGTDTEAGLAGATRLARRVIAICREVAWEVDAALRPEGNQGALVRTVASHAAYYRRWASTWEFQALLKARPVAGDADVGRAYLAAIEPLVWLAAERPDFVADVRSMRRRVIEHVPVQLVGRELKLGPGGLRDVEFAVQLLQLVHGRADETLRTGSTVDALAALRDGGYVGRDDAGRLIEAYEFLRATEHRLQLRHLRRTHLMPDRDADQDWLARSLGYRPGAAGARAAFTADWERHAREVRRLHEKLFYRPLLDAVARVPSQDLRLTAGEAGRRLAAFGFTDPDGALRHIEALTAGMSRRAALQRTLLPVLLSDLADAPDPDAGLLGYRQVSDALGSTAWYLRLLRDGGRVASRLAYLLGTSRYVTRLLTRAPEALPLLAGDAELRPRAEAEIAATMHEAAARQTGAGDAVAVVRGVRRHELLRTAFADLLGVATVDQVCGSISAITGATLDTVLRVAMRSVAAERGLDAVPIRFAVIAMGRLGGRESGYGSDADVLFVHQPGGGTSDEDGTRLAREVAERLRALLTAPTSADPPLALDADLRPEGRNGPLVRSLASYRGYYERWAQPWEKQALLRARFLAGDSELGERFRAVIDPIRYPAGGLAPAELTEIRRVKGRVDSERLPRGADPHTHTKLGPGGLADVEWTAQLLQLRHGGAVPALRTTGTLAALSAAAGEGLITADQADVLATAWRSATRLRNAVRLVRDKPEDSLPHQGVALLGVGRAAGYPAGFDPGQVLDDYRRAARRARAVVEQVFYG